jgi:phosphate transport system protein
MPADKHILSRFDDALEALRGDAIMMASLTEKNLRNAMRCLVDRGSNLCSATIADEGEIDELEKSIDADGVELLRGFQPVASDLRQIVSIIKICSNLERIADQAVNIAKRCRKLNRDPNPSDTEQINAMFAQALGMVQDSMSAYRMSNVNLARSVLERDKMLDQMNHDLATTLTTTMGLVPERITDYLNLLFIARHLERVGDHAENIAEDAIYAASAEDVRHNKVQA